MRHQSLFLFLFFLGTALCPEGVHAERIKRQIIGPMDSHIALWDREIGFERNLQFPTSATFTRFRNFCLGLLVADMVGLTGYGLTQDYSFALLGASPGLAYAGLNMTRLFKQSIAEFNKRKATGRVLQKNATETCRAYGYDDVALSSWAQFQLPNLNNYSRVDLEFHNFSVNSVYFQGQAISGRTDLPSDLESTVYFFDELWCVGDSEKVDANTLLRITDEFRIVEKLSARLDCGSESLDRR